MTSAVMCVDEVLSIIPDLKNRRVLVLGEKLDCSAVEKLKGSNCQVVEESGSELDQTTLKAGTYDCVISCGFLSTLSDDKVIEVLNKVLILLKPDGMYAFCEDCFARDGLAGDVHVRSIMFYNSAVESIFEKCMDDGNDGDKNDHHHEHYVFEIAASLELKSNSRMFWLLTKTKSKSSSAETFGFKTFQEFLNKKQYTCNGVLRYERIFGDGFISTGGIDTTKEFVELLKLKPDEHVLDVGSGIGGGAFYMASTFNVQVTGIDLSPNVVAIALERSRERKIHNVTFEVCDATKKHFGDGSFDVVYSRDTILHIADKKALFTSFYKWLKPGGRLLISDYSCKHGDWSDDFQAYVKQRGYTLLSVESYGKLLEEVGFKNVRAEDRTDQFVEVLKKEIDRITEVKESFLKDFTESDYNALVDGWKDKVKRCGEGDQKWGLFYAEKCL